METTVQSQKLALIVEDNPSDAMISKFILSDMNFISLHALNGLDALDYLENYDFSLIVVDLQMPIMSGTELLKRLKARKISAPILVTSGKNKTRDVRGAIALGAKDYIVKPMDVAIYKEKVSSLTAQQETQWFQYEIAPSSPDAMMSARNEFQIRSISEIGCIIRTSYQISEGTLLHLSSPMLARQGLNEVLGRVLYSEKKNDQVESFIGFVAPSEEQKQKIRLLCRSLWTQK